MSSQRRLNNILRERVNAAFQQYAAFYNVTETLNNREIDRIRAAKIEDEKFTGLSASGFNKLVYTVTGTLLQQKGVPVDKDRLKNVVIGLDAQQDDSQTRPPTGGTTININQQGGNTENARAGLEFVTAILGFLGLFTSASAGVAVPSIVVNITQPDFIPVMPARSDLLVPVLIALALLMAIALIARIIAVRMGCALLTAFGLMLVILIFGSTFAFDYRFIADIFPAFNPDEDALTVAGFIALGVVTTLTADRFISNAFGRLRANPIRVFWLFFWHIVFAVVVWCITALLPLDQPDTVIILGIAGGMLALGLARVILAQLAISVDYSFLFLNRLFSRLTVLAFIILIGTAIATVLGVI